MSNKQVETIKKQLNLLIQRTDKALLYNTVIVDDLYHVYEADVLQFSDQYPALCASFVQLIDSCTPANSYYSTFARQLNIEFDPSDSPARTILQMRALAVEVIHALDEGYFETVTGLIHAEVFGDYLDMAQHLLDEGYKDAAAVMAGGTLESHLRRLCVKNGIKLTAETAKGTDRPRKSSDLNVALKKHGVYPLYTQKMITARLDLRNNAAHGDYDKYTKSDVQDFINWMRGFVDQYRA